MPVRHHAEDIEILDDHGNSFTGQLRRELVQTILANIMNACMNLRNPSGRRQVWTKLSKEHLIP